MAAIANVWFKLEKLEQIVNTLKAKGENGIAIDFGMWDEPNQYNQNVSAWVALSKEQREQGAEKFYCGNGRVVWKDDKGVTVLPYKQETVEGLEVASASSATAPPASDGLPF
jgi:hypothetical protein